MKKYINKILPVLLAFFIVTGCEENEILFDASQMLVGFSSTSLVLSEAGDAGEISIYLGAEAGATATATLEVSTDGFDTPAEEGVDFNIETTSVQLETGVTTITVTPIDNDEFTGDKKVNLIISADGVDYQIANENILTLTISDDEHPLKNWIGNYAVAAPSYGNPGAWDEAWSVVTSPVEGNLDQLSIEGVGAAGTGPLIATIDTDAMTITIEGGQNIGDAYGWGDVFVYYGYEDLTYDDSLPLTGTIQNDGTILVDNWCHFNDGWVWDCFNTIWTKQ